MLSVGVLLKHSLDFVLSMSSRMTQRNGSPRDDLPRLCNPGVTLRIPSTDGDHIQTTPSSYCAVSSSCLTTVRDRHDVFTLKCSTPFYSWILIIYFLQLSISTKVTCLQRPWGTIVYKISHASLTCFAFSLQLSAVNMLNVSFLSPFPLM